MNQAVKKIGAETAPNQSIEIDGRRLAYRSIGQGKPIVLCNRFRGTLDVWDPAFLDALAAEGFRVITFDYSGLGLSTGEKNYDPAALARDARDILDGLDLQDAVIGGWSLGGMAAQIVVAMYPQRVSHAVLIGTTPPGPIVKPAEQLFYDTARIPDYGLPEETILFFEPMSAASRQAAERSSQRLRRRTQHRSPPVPVEFAVAFLGDHPRVPPFPADQILSALQETSIPILHVGGDHDIIFPVENWYALNGQWATLHLHTFPRSGHGPQHEHPQAAAECIGTFVRGTTSRR